MASQLRFGAFLTEHFAQEIVELRRARERAAEQALHASDIPVAEIEPVTAVGPAPRAPAPVPVAPPVEASSPRQELGGISLQFEEDRARGAALGKVALVILAVAAAAAAAWAAFS
jgi:hypothetical protein